MYTPPWMISQRAESSPAIADLSHKLASSLDEGHVWMEGSPKRWTGDDEGDFIDDIISDLSETDDLQLSNKEAWRITQLLSRADLLWGYGISSGEGQLFDIRTPSIRRALDDDSITVLTGVAGLRLRGQLSKINRLAEKLTRTPHESRVLIGSLALSVSGGAPRDGSGEGFEVSSGGGIASSIQLFDTAHGDFRMRQVSRTEAMCDPFGNEAVAAPRLETQVAGYHSIEPELLTAILIHQASRQGRSSLKGLADSVIGNLSRRNLQISAGPFGDWGQDDGRHHARVLESALNPQGDSGLARSRWFVVDPAYSDRLLVESEEAGVRFLNTRPGEALDDEASIFISNDKIPQLVEEIIAYACTGGRTSPEALIRVLEATRGA